MKKLVGITLMIIVGLALAPSNVGAKIALSQADLLRAHVERLASEEFQGRGTGEEGIRFAEQYIADSFNQIGLAPLPGRDTYFVPFTLYRQGYDLEQTYLKIESSGVSQTFDAGKNFRPFPFSTEGSVSAPIVFVGYGITAPEFDYDDYDGIDVKGKIAFMLRHEPGEKDPESAFKGAETTEHSQFSTKADNAKAHGAVGMILVTDPINHKGSDDLRIGGGLSLTHPESQESQRGTPERTGRPERPDASETEAEKAPFVAVQVGRVVADALIEASGRSLEELQLALDGGTQAAGLMENGPIASLGVMRGTEVEEVQARDVAGFLEGRDPLLKEEWVVVGGHHDHLGAFAGSGDTVFNGADDNASGTAGVLALAHAFASVPERPRSSIVFVTFSGEERGLLGSRALVNQDLIPVERLRFMLNLDMIGRNSNQPLAVIGDGFGRGIREIVEDANSAGKVNLEFAGSEYMGASDHDPFYRKDIPFLFFFTGTHEDYHQLGDHVDEIDFPRMSHIVDVAKGLVSQVADADEAPGFIHHISWMGAQVEVLKINEAPVATVTAVDEDSRAAKAGILQGDIVTGFDEGKLEDPKEIGQRFREIQPGTKFDLSLMRDGKPLVVAMERAKTGFLGIFPGPVDEDTREKHGLKEDEGLMIRQVTDDGPAAKAGLLANDIIILIAGQPIGPRTLGRTLSQIGAGETVAITVIRDGERLTLPTTLGERPRFRR